MGRSLAIFLYLIFLVVPIYIFYLIVKFAIKNAIKELAAEGILWKKEM
ncbi:MAG TPA: hypothetical protein GX687_04445 [Clostridia bacterium]|jgi:hypothetical protein|nr:hypothetical protein [Clostridia bacterium]